jgi:hypothetical protein
LAPSKVAGRQAALLEAFSGTARAKIVPAQLFFEKFVAVNDPDTTFDVRFGWITSSPLAHRLKRTPVCRSRDTAWDTSCSQSMKDSVKRNHSEADTADHRKVRSQIDKSSSQ